MTNIRDVIQKCPDCRGTGHVHAPYCSICEQEIEESWWNDPTAFLPCGHDAAALVEWVTCERCDGNGRITRTLAPTEWQARQRRRVLRWVFVALLCVGVTAVITLAIIREPGYLCGSSWYGLIILAIVLNSSFTIHYSQFRRLP
ncbi:MAG: hypothetical protein H6662_06925 [Ardenticatenaceae bacterium]|nr:hypothetical protein [Anaerolineales bacterium]MCB8921299.1 hypothetical protein [Ardenticatenaceae bacterium]MCB8990665.1 hypothetical protein [Ardenticatenaceae bacterium]